MEVVCVISFWLTVNIILRKSHGWGQTCFPLCFFFTVTHFNLSFRSYLLYFTRLVLQELLDLNTLLFHSLLNSLLRFHLLIRHLPMSVNNICDNCLSHLNKNNFWLPNADHQIRPSCLGVLSKVRRWFNQKKGTIRASFFSKPDEDFP